MRSARMEISRAYCFLDVFVGSNYSTEANPTWLTLESPIGVLYEEPWPAPPVTRRPLISGVAGEIMTNPPVVERYMSAPM